MNQRKSPGTTHHRVGRRPNHPPPTPSKGQRPDACRLSALARDYVNRIDECEEKRRRAEAEMDRRSRRRNAGAREREQDEWQRRETVFHQQIRAAHLDEIWIRYACQHPDADHSHKLPFLAWAHTTGAYAHGLTALDEDLRSAAAGRPVTRRRAPGPRQPQDQQQQSRRTHTRPGGPGRTSPPRGNQPGKRDGRSFRWIQGNGHWLELLLSRPCRAGDGRRIGRRQGAAQHPQLGGERNAVQRGPHRRGCHAARRLRRNQCCCPGILSYY